MDGIETRLGTHAECVEVARQVAGVPAEPLFSFTWYGHLVPNPEQAGTLAAAIGGHEFRGHPALPADVSSAMLLPLLRHAIAQLEAAV